MPPPPLNRERAWLLPPTLGELIPDDHPARFVAAFVDSLDRAAWGELGEDLPPEMVPLTELELWSSGAGGLSTSAWIQRFHYCPAK